MLPSDWYGEFKKTGILTGDTKNDGDEHVAYCPSCEDPEESSTPSASFNFKKKKFYCFSCKGKFKFKELLQMAREDAYDRRKAKRESEGDGSKKKAKVAEEPLPSEEQIGKWVDNLHSSKNILKTFQDKRGLSLSIIEQFRIGYRHDMKRYTIPIYDMAGNLVNIRYYGITSRAKMINHTGHGEARLVGFEALEQNEVLLVEGEMDWLTALDQGFNAMTWTSGVSSWQDRFSPMFEGKTVFLCFDDDEAGKIGAQRVGHSLRRAGAAEVYIIQLSIVGIKGGDLTDYFHNLGNTAGDFKDLMNESRETVAGKLKKNKKDRLENVKEVSVEESFDPANSSQTMRVVGTVAGKGAAPYLAPKKVQFTCDEGWGDKCKKCGLSVFSGNRSITVEPEDPMLMKFVDKSDEQSEKLIRKMAQVPPTCPRVDVDEEEQYSIEALQIMPSIESRSAEIVNPVDRTVFNVGTFDIQVNKTYELEGTSMPSPATRSSIFHAWGHKPVEVDIERFKMTPEIKKQLEVFQPDEEWEQSPWEKLKEIAYDLSINVTSIYGRPELHIGYDLVWHSVSSFYFGGRLQQRGWTECIVIGDTRTGKSEAANRLASHYRSGVVVDCENTSLAGLIGGSSQRGASKQWGITWGIIPLNDKRMVVLDEAGGIKPETISAMSGVRSQGIAEVNKMGGQKTSARTRLIWIANPVTKRPIREMSEGAMEEMGEIVPTPEDIARFDFAMSAASDDVSMDQIAHERGESTEHIHHEDECKLLITWCWSRKPEQIHFVGDTEKYIFEMTRKFSARYVEDVPLVQKQSFHLKLARLAAAVAARLFSTDETGENVLVRREHVDTALHFLDTVYGMPSFGYRRYSNRSILDAARARNNQRKARNYILGNEAIQNTLLRVMGHHKFKNRDFEERGGMMREEAAMAADDLIDFGMLKSMSGGYLKMTAELLDLMREIRRERDDELDVEAEEDAEDYA